MRIAPQFVGRYLLPPKKTGHHPVFLLHNNETVTLTLKLTTIESLPSKRSP